MVTIMTWLRRACWLAAGLIVSATNADRCAFAQPSAPEPKMAKPYLNILTTYAVHAKSIWVPAIPGGYWGDGIEAKNANGSVRGMCGTMLAYAMLVQGIDNGWIAAEDKKLLDEAGLTRRELVRFVRENCDYIVAHHKSSKTKLDPQWGFHWQSSLWLGAAGAAVLVIWKDMPAELRSAFGVVVGAEADRIALMPPKTYKNGDTGAEENGWNTAAPALALAMNQGDPRSETWWQALRAYAVNTYSVPADRRTSASVGSDFVPRIVTTANLFPDFTLDNHGFFHPDYVQVSGQHLGEAWQILALGDRIFGTKRAQEFLPYSRHHVADVWTKVMKPLLLPNGEASFPCGNDWTFHCSTIQSYLAFVASALGDSDAALAEERGLEHVRRRRAASPPNRLLGDNNIEWWWEPLVAKRSSTALLHHILSKQPVTASQGTPLLDTMTTTTIFPYSKVWMHRNPQYMVSASWGKPKMGAITPLGSEFLKRPYVTIPVETGILPDTVSTGTVVKSDVADVNCFQMQLPDSKRVVVITMPNSVLWLSPVPLRGLAIENDTLTTPGRNIHWNDGSKKVAALTTATEFAVNGTWMTVDDNLMLISPQGFGYVPAGKFNRKSVAVDVVTPKGEWGAWQMLPRVLAPSAASIAALFKAEYAGGQATVHVKDGATGAEYEVAALLDDAAGTPPAADVPVVKVTKR